VAPAAGATLAPRPDVGTRRSSKWRTCGDTRSAYVSIRQHTSAYVSIRQLLGRMWVCGAPVRGALTETPGPACGCVGIAYVSIRQHTSAYVSIRQVSIRQHTSALESRCRALPQEPRTNACEYTTSVSIHQHPSASVSIRQHTHLAASAAHELMRIDDSFFRVRAVRPCAQRP
jgi:hypothetical protein